MIFFEKFADSLTGQVMQYLSQVNDGSVELQDNPVVLGDKYLVTRNYENGLNVYDLEKDLVPLRLCLAKDNGLKLTRTLRDREVIQMVERSDNLYYAKFGTNFSHETDNQSDIFMDDEEYSGVMIEVNQTKLIDFQGRIHPTSRAPHLVQVERVYWKNTGTWYDSVAEFKMAFKIVR